MMDMQRVLHSTTRVPWQSVSLCVSCKAWVS